MIDRIVKEPVGGAHRDPQLAISTLAKVIGAELDALAKHSPAKLRVLREERFLRIGES